MTETLKKKIVVIMMWVLITAPVHIAMGSVSGFDSHDQSMQSMEQSTTHQLAGGYHNDNEQDKSGGHCKQDTGCKGCDSCSHCLHVICSVTLFNPSTSHIHFISPSISLYQTVNSPAFRPPRLS